MTNAEAIVACATTILKENIKEIQPNLGFDNKEYQAEMESIGWVTHNEWCAYSAILDWKFGYTYNGRQDIWKYFSRLASGNSQQMGRNAHADKFWPTGVVPLPGCIVIYGLGDSQTVGHTALCLSVDPDGVHYTTKEGNSIPPGNPGDEREGYTNAQHIHAIGQPHSVNGLNFLRCIYVVENLT